ncbi:MAG: HAD family hydrolase, partial [Planctomycetota bacterium]
MALRALILDCDGVIVDSERLQLDGFRAPLEPLGIELTEEAYFREVLAVTDADVFRILFEREGRPLPGALLRELVAEKRRYVDARFPDLPAIPGTVEFARRAVGDGLALAVTSGGRGERVRGVV